MSDGRTPSRRIREQADTGPRRSAGAPVVWCLCQCGHGVSYFSVNEPEPEYA